MKATKMHKLIGVGMILFFSIFLTACGRDTSTVDSSLNGRWELADATLNDRPIEEVVMEYEETFGTSEGSEASSAEDLTIDSEFYFDNGELTIVNAEGEQTNQTYEVTNTDEENDSLTLQTPVSNEEVDLTLNSSGNFTDEERESLDLTTTMTDITVNSQSVEDLTALEAEFEQLGQEFAIRILENIELDLSLNYLDDTDPSE